MVVWICYISVMATDILVRGDLCKVKYGPTFAPRDIMKIHDYFCLCRGFGMVIVTFVAWPYIANILIKNPKELYLIEEISE